MLRNNFGLVHQTSVIFHHLWNELVVESPRQNLELDTGRLLKEGENNLEAVGFLQELVLSETKPKFVASKGVEHFSLDRVQVNKIVGPKMLKNLAERLRKNSSISILLLDKNLQC